MHLFLYELCATLRMSHKSHKHLAFVLAEPLAAYLCYVVVPFSEKGRRRHGKWHYINHYAVCPGGVAFNVLLCDNCGEHILLWDGHNGVVMLPQNEKLISQRKIW